MLKPGSIYVRRPYIRFPPVSQVAVQVMVNFNVLENGLIKQSSWASSITVVKNAQWRVVAVRALIHRELRKAPHLHTLDVRHKYFHSLDLIPGYHLIKVTSKDQSKASFLICYQLFQGFRMPS